MSPQAMFINWVVDVTPGRPIDLWTTGGFLQGKFLRLDVENDVVVMQAYNGRNKKQLIYVSIPHIAAWA